MQGFELKLNVYAENEAEVADARAALVEFIDEQRMAGIAVTARKIAQAARGWKSNAFVRNRIIDFLKS